MRREDYELFSRNTQAFIYNMQRPAVQRMLDFDYVCRRETPSVAAIIHPTGQQGKMVFQLGRGEIFVPVYRSLKDAAAQHPNADVMISYASLRSAPQSVKEAFEMPQLRTITVIAEGIPERTMRS